MDINFLAMVETFVQGLLLWLLVIGGTLMGEGEEAGEVVTTEEVAGEEVSVRGEEEGEEGTEVDQGLVQVGTLGTGGQVLEVAMEGKGLVLVEISTGKAKGLTHHATMGKDLGLQDLQEPQPQPPLMLTWGQILETWVPLLKTMLKLSPSFQLAWAEVVEVVVEAVCPRWRISMRTGKKTA